MVVVGLGYLGATHAVAMSELGHDVVGIDVDANKVAKLQEGVLPFYEPGLDTALVENLAKGHLKFSTDFSKDTSDADVYWICVGTPQKKDGLSADLSYLLDSVSKSVSNAAENKDVLIAGKSTVPVGTSGELNKIIDASGKANVHLAWNPEFLREGTALEDSLHPDRIVIGIQQNDTFSENAFREAYAEIIKDGTPFIVADITTAELVKVAANSFLATKISFINAMAEVSEIAGADVVKLSEALGYDERIGNKFLKSGVGFGGGCLPKDVRAFIARAEELGAGKAVEFLQSVDEINLRRRQKTVQLVLDELGDNLTGKRVAVLGGAFKPDSDDIRDSPSLAVAIELERLGADVLVHDPKAADNVTQYHPQLKSTTDIIEAFKNADVVLHLTEWKTYREINPNDYNDLVNNKVIIDGRNALDVRLWENAGWTFHALGRAIKNL